ncbi:flagellar biosynthesis protein FlhF [Alicyclobacillus fastidiosus]|uniref:Flagellar biosynthesis protein FlhF n=1 Tax=Alicyclobacillus fastidiosus TaxID=392011 RepID=A0ABV5AIE3_9BACL|nr:flagellar biosynthesis protein FlhF [Alicyclobacillus fastidiosus]WEH07912.1 flagellar biosynthesis protein FlhF [Alicyclobacillus fastidiosus]
MIVRRYIVRDMPEAVLSIRKDLGKDAVILSTKKVRVKKWLGLRWQTRLEVTAAVGGDIPLHHRDAARAQAKAPVPPAPVKAVEEVDAGPSAGAIEPTAVQGADQDFGSALASAFDAYKTATKAVQSDEPSADVQDVLRELASLKAMIAGQQMGGGPSPVASECVEFLRDQGIEALQAQAWVERALAGANGQGLSLTAALAKVNEVILSDLADLTSPLPIGSNSRVVAFVGPTGVGKTTSIAKIAALHVLAGQRKVGLLTTDTFRIAAVEQLKTYADILDIPLVVVDDESRAAAALEQLRGCDLVLIDTAGRNFRNAETVRYTEQLLRTLAPDETILVAALTAKADDLDDLAHVCELIHVDKFLFTKYDETNSIGSIPRLLMKYRRPLSYVTTGQNVPDDIDMLAIDQILSKWLGGRTDE